MEHGCYYPHTGNHIQVWSMDSRNLGITAPHGIQIDPHNLLKIEIIAQSSGHWVSN